MPTPFSRDTCPECQVGTLQSRAVPYYATLRGMIITITDFPAWVCDVCKLCEYDANAIQELRLILGLAAELPGLPARRHRRAAESQLPWSRTDSRKG